MAQDQALARLGAGSRGLLPEAAAVVGVWTTGSSPFWPGGEGDVPMGAAPGEGVWAEKRGPRPRHAPPGPSGHLPLQAHLPASWARAPSAPWRPRTSHFSLIFVLARPGAGRGGAFAAVEAARRGHAGQTLAPAEEHTRRWTASVPRPWSRSCVTVCSLAPLPYPERGPCGPVWRRCSHVPPCSRHPPAVGVATPGGSSAERILPHVSLGTEADAVDFCPAVNSQEWGHRLKRRECSRERVPPPTSHSIHPQGCVPMRCLRADPQGTEEQPESRVLPAEGQATHGLSPPTASVYDRPCLDTRGQVRLTSKGLSPLGKRVKHSRPPGLRPGVPSAGASAGVTWAPQDPRPPPRQGPASLDTLVPGGGCAQASLRAAA